MKSSRALAVRILTPLFADAPSGNLTEQFDAQLHKADEKSQGLVKELCFGVCRHYLYLHNIALALLSKPLKKKDKDIELLILIGIYQLKFLRTPDHASINETVAACAPLKKPWAKGLINGVLRNYLREQDKITAGISQDYSVQTSHPSWLVDALKADWPTHYRDILEANNQPAPLSIRVNLQQQNLSDTLASLSAANISAKACAFSKSGITLENAVSVENLPGFNAGLCSIQDESAQLAAELLKLEPGQRVLDACAAPGGKTCHILENQADIDQLIALDKVAPRLDKVRSNLSRLNLHAELKAADAADLSSWWDNQLFQRILLDAPCSATGIIRRHPDIKWLRKERDISTLAQQQLQLLKILWQTLAPGGILLYATCSVLKQENENLVGQFLSQTNDAQEIKITADWGISTTIGRQIFPKTGGQDGFYYARLRKCIPE
ncbi:MAG: 16S rRNA (cytosine(967)-C(5))-methyltransferase RsmB [Gammaproteobacteria bacterium]|nr:16S rRNA (cytosine(967)-C(5))-methyltransferase RsmB [Gammaproteobacteria bacterium]